MDKKILLVADDDDMNRLIIKKFLKNEYEVLEAANGQQAMQLLHSTHVDVLLLDIIMPEMDGLEVLTAMKKEKELDQIGVLVATSTKEKTEREALSLGADDIVAKPYDPVVIKKRMENILAMKMLQTQHAFLQKDDMKSYIQNKNEQLINQLETPMKKINKFADIIKANKSNFKLVDEIIAEIKLETNGILDIIKKKD